MPSQALSVQKLERIKSESSKDQMGKGVDALTLSKNKIPLGNSR